VAAAQAGDWQHGAGDQQDEADCSEQNQERGLMDPTI